MQHTTILHLIKYILTLKAKFIADDILFFFYLSEKISLDISCESSAWQTIHMKYPDLFSLKNKKKIKKIWKSSATKFAWCQGLKAAGEDTTMKETFLSARNVLTKKKICLI